MNFYELKEMLKQTIEENDIKDIIDQYEVAGQLLLANHKEFKKLDKEINECINIASEDNSLINRMEYIIEVNMRRQQQLISMLVY